MAVAPANNESVNGTSFTMSPGMSRKDLAAFKPPEFTFPYSVTQNPFHLGQQTDDWFRHWLLETEVNKVLPAKIFEKLLKTRVPKLASYAHPITALGQWGYQWITKFTGFVFILDDIVDATEIGKDLKAILSITLDLNLMMMWSFPDDPQLHDNIRSFLGMAYSEQECEEKMKDVELLLTEARSKRGTAYPKEIVISCKSFAELWTDALKRSAPSSMLLIANYTQNWLLGVFQEAGTRKKDIRPPSIESHIDIRRKTSAVLVLVMIREVGSGLKTPRHWLESPQMVQAMEATSDLIAWDNDIVSFSKEALVDEDITCNLVAVISKYKSVNHYKATEILQKMMTARMAELEASLADLEKITPLDLIPNFHIYVEALHCSIAGCHAWFSESPRYHT